MLSGAGPAVEPSGVVAPKEPAVIGGACHCGQVRYAVVGPVVRCSFCDCRGCQRATGALKAPFVTVRRADFRIVQGVPTEFRSDSGAKCDARGTWFFCPACGTTLYWRAREGAELDLLAGTLDDPRCFDPPE